MWLRYQPTHHRQQYTQLLKKKQEPVKQNQKQSIPQTSDKILLESCFSDPELVEIVKAWPDLPEHIKAAVKAIVQAYMDSKGGG